MKLAQHADHTEKIVGLRAEDIHKWIDGFFDHENFDAYLASGRLPTGFDPYDHRKFRHCREALEEAIKEFEGKYTPEQIQAVFESHIKDDYGGYFPNRVDFENGTFAEKYHEREEPPQNERIFSKEELVEYFEGKSSAQEKKFKRHLGTAFNLRIVLPTVLAIFLFVGAIIWFIIPMFRSTLLNQKKQMILELTASAVSIVKYYVQQSQIGELSLAEAQERAKRELKSMRYGRDNKDYFWITDRHPTMIMHPYREDLMGQDLTDYRDADDTSGIKLFVEAVRITAVSNEGFLKYHWQWKDRPGMTVMKLSYVRGIPEWEWIIGTGVYLDDVETEMNRLSQDLFLTFFYITLGLFLFLLYIVRQSKRIERNRQRAESGLMEAKERYRALVESSNEGYILEIAGEHVYCNHTLERLVGYTEAELLSTTIWDQLLTDSTVNDTARHHLNRIVQGHSTLAEFPAQISHKNGTLVDVSIRTSRLYFLRKNGHVIAFRPIVRKIEFDVAKGFSSPFADHDPASISPTLDTSPIHDKQANEANLTAIIANSQSNGEIIHALNQLPSLISKHLESRTEPHTLRKWVGQVYDETLRKVIEFSLKELPAPPCPFAFVSLGSNARYEMTIFSDQDNALVFAEPDPEKLEESRLFFLRLGESVCRKLDLAGFPYCGGGVIASNPRWCLSLNEWLSNIGNWISSPTPEALMEVNIAFDLRFGYGDESIVDTLIQYTFEGMHQSPNFFLYYAHNCLKSKPLLTVFGQIKTETTHGLQAINLKDCLFPIVLFARLYSLKYCIRKHTTYERIQELQSQGILKDSSAKDLLNIFDFLWRLRFFNQIKAHEDLRKVDDALAVNQLSDVEYELLKKSLSQISIYQSKVACDFPGCDAW